VFVVMPFMGIDLFRGGNRDRNGLPALIQAYKAILIALYPTNPINPNFCPNPSLKKHILVQNW